MLNPIASSEAIYSATYVDNYIDSVENLPDDVQRHLSRIRDIDVQYRGHIRDVDRYYDMWKTLPTTTDNVRRERALVRMQTSLIRAQELGDEKMHIVSQLQELIDHKTRQLDSDQTNLDIKEEQHAAQHQHGLREDLIYSGATQKVSRSQSPIGVASAVPAVISVANAGQSPTVVGKESPSAFATVALVHTGANGSASADRSNGGNPITGSGSNVNISYSSSNTNVSSSNSNNSNAASGDGRLANKRSRRQRNDVNINAMEIGGNESNSANEGGGSGDRGCVTGGAAHKQSNSNQASILNSQKKSNQGTSGSANTLGAGTSSGSGSASTSKKKRRKARGAQASNAQANAREDTPPVDPIDPDEPTYCLCDQISFGEMILCDNDLCPIEWFHFSCVSLVLKPKGKWYCPNCRGDRPNVMKPKAQFLKELERYNKEKEEKT